MGKGRQTKLVSKDGRRCFKCKKLAKDKIDGEYLCRLHSPMREGFARLNKKKKDGLFNK